MNLLQVTRTFQTEEDCLDHLEKMRWPEGIRCPICGNDQICKGTRKATAKNKRTRFYQCLEKNCKQQFSATNGTIFHKSHLPLSLWFMAINIMMDAKKGISALQLQQHLGIGSYKTAWYLNHRIRKAMVDINPEPLKGTIEIDETYWGGRAVRRNKERPAKSVILAMRERSTKHVVGRVRFFHIPDGKLATIQPILWANIKRKTARVVTDESAIYKFSFNAGRLRHPPRTVNHSKEWVVPGTNIHTNTVESSFSLLKRGLIGSFHHVSVKHLHRYLAEFEYRFNNRRNPERFLSAISKLLTAKPMQYQALTADA